MDNNEAAKIVAMAAKTVADAASIQAQSHNALSTATALMAKDIEYIKSEMKEIRETLKMTSEDFVSKNEFMPVQRIAYGLVGLALISILGALFKLILKV